MAGLRENAASRVEVIRTTPFGSNHHSTASTGLRKPTSKFKPAIGSATLAKGPGCATLRKKGPSVSRLAVPATADLEESPNTLASTPQPSTSSNCTVVHSSHDSLLSITRTHVPRKRLSSDLELTTDASPKRLKSFAFSKAPTQASPSKTVEQTPIEHIDLNNKSSELLNSYLMRNIQYREFIANNMFKHIGQTETHDIVVLSLMMNTLDDRMAALKRRIMAAEDTEFVERSALLDSLGDSTVDLRMVDLTSPRATTPPSLLISHSLTQQNHAKLSPPPPTVLSPVALVTPVVPSSSEINIASTTEARFVSPEPSDLAQNSADSLTIPDSDDQLWDALDTDMQGIFTGPSVEIGWECIQPESSLSTLTRVDHTASPHYAEVISILKTIFKLSHFRKNQLECIIATLDRKDVFYVAPTGGGKSLCYQLPALCKEGRTQGTTFVISPLLALIQDQVSGLREKGIQAFCLINATDTDEAHDALPRLRRGETLSLVYTTPEKLLSSHNVQDVITQLYEQNRLARFVVDEAHVVEGWRVFRGSYALLGTLRERWPDVPIMALTASANKATMNEIKGSLALRDPVCLTQSFNRSNLHYEVRRKPNQKKELFQEIAGFIQSRHKDDTGIIYCLSRDDCEGMAQKLRDDFNLSTRHFHAGMDREDKRQTQEQWSKGHCKIIVATIAFGMGIDKSDVRFVIHATMSKDMDGYYQETGRAGRDGRPSDCVLFYAYGDAIKLRHMVKNGENNPPKEEVERHLDRLSTMTTYCSNETECRRVLILRHFGESFDEAECHKGCDNCCNSGKLVTEECRHLAQQATRLLGDMTKCNAVRRITMRQFKDVWQGKKGKTVAPFTGIPYYGAAANLDLPMVERIVGQLLQKDIFAMYRTTTKSRFVNNYLQLGSKSQDCLDGNIPFAVSYRMTGEKPKSYKPPAKKVPINSPSKKGKSTVLCPEPRHYRSLYQDDINDFLSDDNSAKEVDDCDDLLPSSSRSSTRSMRGSAKDKPMSSEPARLLERLQTERDRLSRTYKETKEKILLDETLEYIACVCPTDSNSFRDAINECEDEDEVDEKYEQWSGYFLRICKEAATASATTPRSPRTAFNVTKMHQSFAFTG